MFSTKNIEKYLNDKPKSYFIFNIKYNKKEKKCINNFEINKYTNFKFFGNLENMTYENILIPFLENIGNNSNENVIIMNNIINKLIKNICKSYQKNDFWVSIRVSLPNTDFNIPRWHYDGPFFLNNPDAIQAKFITIFKGPGTLFLKNEKESNEIFQKIKLEKRKELIKIKNNNYQKIDEIDNKYRPIINEALNKFKKTELKNNEGLIFSVNMEKHFIHSEPCINEHRLFISILPGSREDIEELKLRFGK